MNDQPLAHDGPTTLRYQVTPTSPDADRGILGAFWKVIVIQKTGHTGVTAFIMSLDAERAADYVDRLSTIEKIQRRSGFNLFPGMSPGLPEAQNHS